jgi:serine/threonine-protein kinase
MDEAHRSGPRSHVPGEHVAGKYQLVRPLDEGGMGVVWVAHHVDLDVQVALKVLRFDDGDPAMAERLLREAQSAARLDHPAVVRVLDTGRTEAGEPFLVMELLAGESLARVLEREPRLDPVRAVRTLLPIAGALAAMHERDMIHRDVKPENIFLARDDAGRQRPKLIDFGLARVPSRRITQRGAVMGTPGYLPPEQLRGEDGDALADVWALSAVLYESVAGVRPLPGETYLELLQAIAVGRIAPLADHGVDEEELWAIVARGLRPAAQRWSTMRELGVALAGWLWSRGVTEDVSGASLRGAWLAEDDVRRLPRSQVVTARFPARIEVPPPPPAATVVDLPSVRATAVTMPAGPIVAPVAPVARGARWVLPAVAVVAALGVGAGGALWWARGSAREGAPEAAAAVPAAASAAAMAMATATATATGAPEPAGSVPAPAASTAAPAPKRPAVRRPPPGSELKNPFH